MDIRTETWNGHPIRFVGEGDHWDAIGFDVATALGYKRPNDAIKAHVNKQDTRLINISTVKRRRTSNGSALKRGGTSKGGSPVMIVISEFGIYSLIFKSQMKQAKEFQRWVYKVLVNLRRTAGLQGYQAFRMLDKRVQQQAMARLEPVSDKDYIKANVIADKAVSNLYGLPKMIKKRDMTPEMLKDRPTILSDVVDLMNAKKKFNLDISVSDIIYRSIEKNKGDGHNDNNVSSRQAS